MNIKEKKALWIEASEAYYNSEEELMSDAEFDSLTEEIREVDPNWDQFKKTGVSTGNKKFERKLDAPCPSLDKIQSDVPGSLNKFLSSNPDIEEYLVGDKIDGSSVQTVYEANEKSIPRNGRKYLYPVRMATRGDGSLGKDLSGFIHHLNIPKRILVPDDINKLVIRQEAVIPKAVWKEKWQGDFLSARAMSSALLNRQDIHPALKELHIVALKVQYPVMSITEGLKLLKDNSYPHIFACKKFKVEDMEQEKLAQLVVARKDKSPYELDGLVLISTKKEHGKDTVERPSHSKAFKLNDLENAPTTEVVDIVYKLSSHGKIVPKAVLKPIMFDGVTVKHAALHNPRLMIINKLGIGSKVKLIRSGDIIPKIVKVLTEGRMVYPDRDEFGEYSLVGTNFVVMGDSKDLRIKKLNRFFQKLGFDEVAMDFASKAVEAGYDEPHKVIKMTKHEIAQLPGVVTTAGKYYKQIRRVLDGEYDFIQLMVASCIFDTGVGSRKIKKVYDVNKALLGPKASKSADRSLHLSLLQAASGTETGSSLWSGLPKFWKWVEEHNIPWKMPEEEIVVEGNLNGKKFSWTTYRDKAQEEKIKSLGGEVISFSASKTDVLFYSPTGKASGKVDAAKKSGRIEVVSDFNSWIKDKQ